MCRIKYFSNNVRPTELLAIIEQVSGAKAFREHALATQVDGWQQTAAAMTMSLQKLYNDFIHLLMI